MEQFHILIKKINMKLSSLPGKAFCIVRHPKIIDFFICFISPAYAKVRSVCVLVLLYIPLCMMDIPGPCRHSITKEHLLQINHLVSGSCFVFYCILSQLTDLLLMLFNDWTNKGTGKILNTPREKNTFIVLIGWISKNPDMMTQSLLYYMFTLYV